MLRHSYESGNPVFARPFPATFKRALIGVGRASCSPSLRTVQADLPHTALQSVVLPGEGLTNCIINGKRIQLTSNEASTARFSRWVVNMPNFDRNSVFSLASTEAAPACLARGHWRWLRFCPDRRHASTSLPPLAPSPLRDFTATMEALTPVRPALRPLHEHRLLGEQVSLIHASDLLIIPSPTTLGLPSSLSHPTPQRVGLLTPVSPGFATESQARQLSGRIAFVILRTDRSPPAAPPPSEPYRRISRLRLSSRWFYLVKD